MSPSEDFSTATYAIVAESVDVDLGGYEGAARASRRVGQIPDERRRGTF